MIKFAFLYVWADFIECQALSQYIYEAFLTYVKNDALDDATLVRHVPDDRGHVVVLAFDQGRTKDDGQVTGIHLQQIPYIQLMATINSHKTLTPN